MNWPDFREPLLLWTCLLAVPAYFLVRAPLGRLRFSALSLWPRRHASWRVRMAWLPAGLLAGGVVLLGVALAGPRLPGGMVRERREGIAIMMVMDLSGSMAALDMSTEQLERTRLDAVKEIFIDFVQGTDGGLSGRPDDAIGLISFARYADTSCPLTLDHASLVSIARDLEIVRSRAEDGTALGDALGLAVERLRESKARSRVAILLTDGVSNTGVEAPLDAAKVAASQGIKVYTVGVGSIGFAPVRVEDPFSGRSVLRQVPVDVDEPTLEEIARMTGGVFFRATDARALAQVYEEIDALEKTEIHEERFVLYRELFELTTAAALVLVGLGWLLGASVFRRLP